MLDDDIRIAVSDVSDGQIVTSHNFHLQSPSYSLRREHDPFPLSAVLDRFSK